MLLYLRSCIEVGRTALVVSVFFSGIPIFFGRCYSRSCVKEVADGMIGFRSIYRVNFQGKSAVHLVRAGGAVALLIGKL